MLIDFSYKGPIVICAKDHSERGIVYSYTQLINRSRLEANGYHIIAYLSDQTKAKRMVRLMNSIEGWEYED
jgi:hypothetical protein